MPAPIKHTKTETFRSLCGEAAARNERNDCAVKAVAAVCDVSYEEAHAALAHFGRRPRDGAYTDTIHNAVMHLGGVPTKVNPRAIIDSYPKPHCDKLKNITTHHPDRFASVWPAGRYLLYTAGHVAAVVDGENHDWTRGSAKRVVSVYKIS